MTGHKIKLCWPWLGKFFVAINKQIKLNWEFPPPTWTPPLPPVWVRSWNRIDWIIFWIRTVASWVEKGKRWGRFSNVKAINDESRLSFLGFRFQFSVSSSLSKMSSGNSDFFDTRKQFFDKWFVHVHIHTHTYRTYINARSIILCIKGIRNNFFDIFYTQNWLPTI